MAGPKAQDLVDWFVWIARRNQAGKLHTRLGTGSLVAPYSVQMLPFPTQQSGSSRSVPARGATVAMATPTPTPENVTVNDPRPARAIAERERAGSLLHCDGATRLE